MLLSVASLFSNELKKKGVMRSCDLPLTCNPTVKFFFGLQETRLKNTEAEVFFMFSPLAPASATTLKVPP